MKRNLVNIRFETDIGNFSFVGFVTTKVIDPAKLFLKAFGRELPDGAQITLI